MKWTFARVLAGSTAALAVVVPGVLAAPTAVARRAPVARRAAVAEQAGSAVSAVGAALARGAAPDRPGGISAVVLIGIPGLRWSDITPAAAPALWRLAEAGSVGSLAVTTIDTLTCPADAWLTLNSGARAIDPHPASGPCPGLPAVVPQTDGAGQGADQGAAGARVPALPGLIRSNRQYSYQPDWGLLGRTGTGQCATAIGPGAAIALASSSGQVASYVPGLAGASRSALNSCALTVADLGALPAPAEGSAGSARGRALHAADQAAARIIAAAPAGAIIVVAGVGDESSPHLRAIVVSGPGFRSGLLLSPSTRQPGLLQLTDLTPSVLSWLGWPVPGSLVGSKITSTSRGGLGASVRGLIGQDTAAQVYPSTLGWFFSIYAVAEIALFSLIALLLRGGGEDRRRRRRAAFRVAGVASGAVPAGTFLASLISWQLLPHPALVLYGLAMAWAALIAAAALAGPWRRDPFGPPGFVAAVTVAVIALDVITGSHLQANTPFGQSVLVGNRFYGVGNSAIVVYGAAGILCATWAAAAVLRRGPDACGRALAAAGAVALFAVVVCGWPGLGAKVGGTIALVPAFALLLAAIAGLKITLRRAPVIVASGLVLIAAFALTDYLAPGIGPSDIGAFVGHVLHGGAGAILHRKVSSNLHSLTESWLAPAVPVVVIAAGAMIAWPASLGMRTLEAAFGSVELLRPALTAIWLAALLGWLADDSGVSVPAAAMPFALPMVIAVVSGLAAASDAGMPEICPRPGMLPHHAGRASL